MKVTHRDVELLKTAHPGNFVTGVEFATDNPPHWDNLFITLVAVERYKIAGKLHTGAMAYAVGRLVGWWEKSSKVSASTALLLRAVLT